MEAVGPPLFEAGDLSGVLLASLRLKARDVVLDLMVRPRRTSRLMLRRAIVPEVAFHDGLVLGKPGPIELTVGDEGGAGPVTASCAVPFDGDGRLFQLAAPVWPPPRPLRGVVEGRVLRLVAQGRHGDAGWLPAVLGADLMLIRQVLAAQTAIVARYHRELEFHVRDLVDRVYPRVDRAELRMVRDWASLADEPYAAIMQREIDAERARLWKAWTR